MISYQLSQADKLTKFATNLHFACGEVIELIFSKCMYNKVQIVFKYTEEYSNTQYF